MDQVILRRPQLKDEATFLKTALRAQKDDPNFLHSYEDGMSFHDWLQVLEQKHNGLCPVGHVPSTFYFGFVQGEIVGRLSIRHQLNDFLTKLGGHIGYFIVPEQRRKGYATAMFRQSLIMAKERGLEKVLVTCDVDNIASRKTIENCGGVLENIVEVKGSGPPTMRFWIDLNQ